MILAIILAYLVLLGVVFWVLLVYIEDNNKSIFWVLALMIGAIVTQTLFLPPVIYLAIEYETQACLDRKSILLDRLIILHPKPQED